MHPSLKATSKSLNDILESVEQYIAEQLIGPKYANPRSVVSSTLQRFPNCEAMDICFVLVAIAAALETPIVSSSEDKELDSLELFKAIAAFFADIYAYERCFGQRPNGRNILDYWKLTEDRYFDSR